MVVQTAIFIFSMSAIWLLNDPRPRYRRWGSVCGLLAQPFWYYESWTKEQWGIFASSFAYSYAFARGFYYAWLVEAKWWIRAADYLRR